jgi:UDP-N-acetylglucosamine--N-acetylmuramyl-(pentapeptide) pyrophosphoryl-undecaprenol N-acetylglucosamine transferase
MPRNTDSPKPDQGARPEPYVMIAAGGTGGHLFPAYALAQELQERNIRVDLITDDRGHRYGGTFPAARIFEIPAASLQLRFSLSVITGAWRIMRGIIKAQRVLHRNRPDILVGFGGYPSLPPLAAGLLQGIAICLHEQNAVMGRVNRLFAPFARGIASAFPKIRNVSDRVAAKIRVTGNPVRASVLELLKSPYQAPASPGKFNVVVFGGSQGARIFADVVPGAIADLPAGMRDQLKVTQQTRPEDLERVRAVYEKADIDAEIEPFFSHLPQRIADAHLVIARAGASTVSELSAIGRPAILVPLPHSLDNDQLHNAHHFVYSGGGWLIEQNDLSVERLNGLLVKLRYSPEELSAAAGGAAELGKPEAVVDLADLVLELARDKQRDGVSATTPEIEPADTMLDRRRHGQPQVTQKRGRS